MYSLIKLSKPITLFLAALTYLLGASIAGYLGKSLIPPIFLLGLLLVLFLQICMNLLVIVFQPINEPIIKGETIKERNATQSTALYVSIVLFVSIFFILYIVYATNHVFMLVPPSQITFLFIAIFIIVLYAVFPFRLVNHGFGEFLMAIQIAFVIPSISFLLHNNEYHRLLFFVIVPLTFLALAYFLVLNFPSFAEDEKYERGTLLRLLTWQHAVPLHHSLIIFTYVVFALAPIFSFSFNLIWPAFLTLPFAIFQIIQIHAIANGNPPNWKLLTSTALAVFGLTTYFLTLTFWLR